jgi:hypothetical protein
MQGLLSAVLAAGKVRNGMFFLGATPITGCFFSSAQPVFYVVFSNIKGNKAARAARLA